MRPEHPDQYRVVADRSVPLDRLGLYAVLAALPFVALIVVAFMMLWGRETIVRAFSSYMTNLEFGAWMIVGVLLHELIHGLTWAGLSRLPWRTIRFGFDAKTFTPFAHSPIPLRANVYRWGAVMPLLVLGLVPTAIGIATGHARLMAFGAFFTLAAGGDVAILWMIRDISSSALVLDHPTRGGCQIVERSE